MADRDPNELSNWAVTHSSMENHGYTGPHTEGSRETHHDLGAYLLAPESDPHAHSEKPSRRGTRPANLEAGANWISHSTGYFSRPNEGPTETPEHWENVQRPSTPNDPTPRIDQGLLFVRPRSEPAKIEWMRATKAASRRAGTSLGILQNEADRRGLGQLSEGSNPDLSEHSSGLVEKMTGREHAVTNDMTFMGESDHDRLDVMVPRAGEGASFTEPKTEFGDTRETKILSRSEANMGLSRFRVELAQSPVGQARSAKAAARKRQSQPTYTQGELF